MKKDIKELLQQFVFSVIKQNECIFVQNDARTGNEYASKYIKAAKDLIAGGEESINSFCELLDHPHPSVRGTAAAFLMQSRTDSAVATLRDLVKGEGIAAWEAGFALKRYEEGNLEIL